MRKSKSGWHSNFYSESKEFSTHQRGRKPENEGVDCGSSRGPKKRSASVGRDETRSAAAASSSSFGFRESSRRENVIDEVRQLRQQIQSLKKKVAQQRQTMLQSERSNSAMAQDVSEIVRKVERAYADATRLRSPPRNYPCTIQQKNHRTSGSTNISPTDGVAKTWRLGHFETVFLDGRLYVMGGLFKETSVEVLHKGDEVHVLDLGACESTWKRCASMSVVRESFGYAAYEGRIFVFGGFEPRLDKYEYEYSRDREIWTNSDLDPLKNEWSSIEPMPLGEYTIV
ncbi:hypothetical protein R1flu_023677 [Riccia fluitans]|uniref:Uncharacterized protein n=1 Tax=Riccia fluitans TaxID=41844 RepID=A0ABD1XSQ2_9MARC